MGSKRSCKITGKTVEEVRRSAELAIQDIWKEVNKLIDETRSSSIGANKIESSDTGFRLIQEKGSYSLEARFPDGWARLSTATELLTKKD